MKCKGAAPEYAIGCGAREQSKGDNLDPERLFHYIIECTR